MYIFCENIPYIFIHIHYPLSQAVFSYLNGECDIRSCYVLCKNNIRSPSLLALLMKHKPHLTSPLLAVVPHISELDVTSDDRSEEIGALGNNPSHLLALSNALYKSPKLQLCQSRHVRWPQTQESKASILKGPPEYESRGVSRVHDTKIHEVSINRLLSNEIMWVDKSLKYQMQLTCPPKAINQSEGS